MDGLKFVRAFTYRDMREIAKKGLTLPNDQIWNLYTTSDSWPPGLAFDLWTPEMEKRAEWLALTITRITNDSIDPEHPEELVLPGVEPIAKPS